MERFDVEMDSLGGVREEGDKVGKETKEGVNNEKGREELEVVENDVGGEEQEEQNEG